MLFKMEEQLTFEKVNHILNTLKLLKIQNPSLIPGIITPATIRNGFLFEF